MKILITGASQGIGKYLYEQLGSQEQYTVLGTFNSSTQTKELIPLNVTDAESVKKFINENVADSDQELVLINCAAINYNSFTHKSDTAKWEQVIRVNLLGTYHLIQGILPMMRKHNFGRIINFSSVTAIKPTPGISSYAASKAGLSGLVKTVASENASKNITINNINLGYTELGMIKEVPEEFLGQIIDSIPSKRLCEPVDILLTVKYLMECSYITGSAIDLNGGLI